MFYCKLCDYRTTLRFNFDRHLSSDKHKRLNSFNDLDTDSDEENFDPGTSEDDESVKEADTLSRAQSDISNDDPQKEENDEKKHGADINQSNQDHSFFPFKNKLHMLLYMLKNSPTHPVSTEVVKFVIYILKEAGVKNVPSMSDLNKTSFGDFNWKMLLREDITGDETSFWYMKPSELLRLFLANPKYASDIVRFPTTKNCHPSGAAKWQNEIQFHFMKHDKFPIYKGKAYKYKAQDNGKEIIGYGLVKSFIDDMEDDVIKAVIEPLEENISVHSGNHVKPEKRVIPIRSLEECNEQNFMHAESITSLAEKSLPIWTLPINIFVDDTSANRSKRWLGLHCIQMQPSGIKLQFRQNHDAIFFLTASEKVAVSDMLKPLIDDIQLCKREGICGFDAMSKEECLITTELDVVVADFNMQSHLCNHLGASATKYCTKCFADAEDASIIVGERTPAQTLRTIERLNLRSFEINKKKLRQQMGIREHPNPLWDIINPHRDIPIGFLHLMSLGLTKHLVKGLLSMLAEDKLTKLQSHLSSLTKDSFANNFFASIESRQGKDFKKYLQYATVNFAYIGIPQPNLEMLKTLAKIQQILQMDTFNTESIDETDHLIKKYLNLIEENFPALKKKVKTHLLCHMTEDIKRHGPPKGYTEDGFEKNHAAVRNDLFHQNQKQRSRDTAISFANTVLLNHVVSGGYLKTDNAWIQAGEGVQKVGEKQEVKTFMGLNHQNQEKESIIKKLKRKENGIVKTLTEKEAEPILSNSNLCNYYHQEQVEMFAGLAVNTCRNELANTGDAVQVLIHENEKKEGIFREGYIIHGKRQVEVHHIAKIQVMKFKEAEKETGCDVYQLEDNYIYVEAYKVLKLVHIFHHCKKAKCKVGQQKVPTLIHNNINCYIKNTFQL